jgi:hypothetical protein
MQKTLRVGEKLDLEFLTQEELEEVLDERLSGYLRPPQPLKDTASVALDSSGNTTVAGVTRGIPIYRVPAGYRAAIHRLAVIPEGAYTFGSPYTNAGAYLEIHNQGITEDGISLASTGPGIPQVWSAGVADAIYLDNLDVLSILISGGPASINVKINIRGTIRPLIEL